MKRSIITLSALIVVLVLLAVISSIYPEEAVAPTSSNPIQNPIENPALSMIMVDSPKPGQAVTSPVTITGKAKGNWFFEASAPVSVVDWDGKIIGGGHLEAQGDWMTTDFVPFTATIVFTVPVYDHIVKEGEIDPYKRGTIILKNDNPSGDPARDKSIEIPVVFAQ